MMLSYNFTLEEMTASVTARRKGWDNTPTFDAQAKLYTLCTKILQPIRNEWGAPIVVRSGYRCPKLNKAVGGVRNSDHLYGCAADIVTQYDRAEVNKQLFMLIKRMHEGGDLPFLKQCIDEYHYNWIHISYQDGRTSKLGQFLHLG